MMYVKKEALLSSQIEGTQASFVDLLAAERRGRNQASFEIREVFNYVDALNYGLHRSDDIPFSVRLLKEIHGRLLENVRGGRRLVGEFRKSQNWIGPSGSRIEDAEFVPPPVPEMHVALQNLESYYHEDTKNLLVQCALLHAQFETIHPFEDGNGRIGRLLITFFMRDKQLLTRPLLYLSYFLKRNRQRYYESLMRIRTHGDWEGWVKFFLQGIAEASLEATETAQRMIDLEQHDRARLQTITTSPNALGLHRFMLDNPVFDAKHASGALGVTPMTVNKMLRQLEKHRVVCEISGRRWGRVWCYSALMEILLEGTETEPL
jgi:Fic family protein